jgi:hypothetical protein
VAGKREGGVLSRNAGQPASPNRSSSLLLHVRPKEQKVGETVARLRLLPAVVLISTGRIPYERIFVDV